VPTILVAFTIQPAQGAGQARRVIVNLPETPKPGETIELPDGHRVTIHEVQTSTRGDIDAEVTATRYS